MVAANNNRAHGSTGAEEAAKEAAEEATKPFASEEFKPLNLTRRFQRMRMDWDGPNRDVIRNVETYVDRKLHEEFSEAFSIINEIHMVVREPETEEGGEIKFDQYGFPVWKKYEDGGYIEDWERLTQRQIRHFIFKLINTAFADEQKAANAWGRAIFAKAVYEEAFATDFDGHPNPKATVESRSARAEAQAADYRYTAAFEALYSKKADAVVRSMDRISQRLKDLLTQ